MAPTTSNPWIRRSARLALAAVLMFTLAAAGIELTRYSDRIASVWLANGAMLALLLQSDRREWLSLGIVLGVVVNQRPAARDVGQADPEFVVAAVQQGDGFQTDRVVQRVVRD